ncbi:hypothetical protein R6Q59_032952 [Mikania micrantha]
MSSEVRIIDGGGDDDCRVTEWEAGLPNFSDLPPLSQFLISPELASAFSITPEPHRSTIDVDRASRDTLSNLRTQSQHLMNKINDFRSGSEEEVVVEGEDTVDLTEDGSPDRKLRRVGEEDDDSMKTSKRIRLVWTPQLHKRFVEVVAHLGVKKAVPKTIMQLMNVEGLTRENVASHLQKYRLYVKRMQGFEGPSPSDHLFDSTPVLKSLRDSGGGGNENRHAPAPVPIPMPYQPHMVPMSYPPPQIVPSSAGGAYHHRFEYNMMMQPKDWSGNNFGSGSPYQHPVHK